MGNEHLTCGAATSAAEGIYCQLDLNLVNGCHHDVTRYLLPPANEVAGRYFFHKHVVSHSTHRGSVYPSMQLGRGGAYPSMHLGQAVCGQGSVDSRSLDIGG